MELENEKRASILSDALPYIQQYSNKVVVVKYGGNAMTNDKLKQAVMSDLVLLSLCGIKIVLVHGGGPEINAMLKKVGKESKFVNGLRYTDEETINIVQMVLCGKVNKDLVDLLYSHKGRAVGLCGLDDHMIEAEQLDPDLGLVGEITQVNVSLIQVVHLADGVDRDTQVSGNAGKVPGIGKTAHKMDMRLFEVTGPPLWWLPVFLNVGLICLFGVYVLIVQSPGTRKIFLRVLDGRFLTFWVQHKHALPTS